MEDKCALCLQVAEYEYNGQNLCSVCVSKEAIKNPTIDLPKKTRKRNRGKSIDDITVNKDYSGEASPYWEDIAKQHWQPDNNQLSESAEANPDVLPESATPYAYVSSDDEELRAEILTEVVEGLTPRQREILALCEQVGYTEEKAAKQLGITRLAFRTTINRIKVAIETKYEQRKRNSSWQK